MDISKKKELYKTLALTFSLCLLILWSALGAGTSLAWFTDTSPEVNNIFHFADFDLDVYHQLTDGSWQPVGSQTQIFDANALYEPGYTQVVYLKVVNSGDREFQFDTTVRVTGYTQATNSLGEKFKLQDYLKFGLVAADTLSAMKNCISSREKAAEIAMLDLDQEASESILLKPKQETYVALVVRMPEDIGNGANYREDKQPKVELGVIIRAEQLRN